MGVKGKMSNRFAKIILATVQNKLGVSFVDLEQEFAKNKLHYAGAMELAVGNVVFWYGWNQTAANAFIKLEYQNRVHLVPTNPLVYAIDGKTLKYPIAKRPKKDYAKPRWLPCIIKFGPCLPATGARGKQS